MLSRLTREQVVAVAALANLELDSSEIELFAQQLGDILAYADEIRQVNTTGVPPTASAVTRHASDRADEVRPSLDRDEALAGAPDAEIAGGFFTVPRVVG
jgi:aspartyl-tRNA(Asn)/glutamyl-tRNA(Gln) amidotransferase subunit C